MTQREKTWGEINMSKKLCELLPLLPEAVVTGDITLEIEDLVYQSSKSNFGALYICLNDKQSEYKHIDEACRLGAVAVLTEKKIQNKDITVITVPSIKAALEIIVPYFFDYPGRKLRMIGVTGTNGKTTITYLIRSILQHAGIPTGLIGTLGTLVGDKHIATRYTTPEVNDLQAVLAQMVANGMKYVVMEVSSHGLELNRLAGCELDVGILTNITHDHLDFHGSFENYVSAKAKLFQMLSTIDASKSTKTAITNVDDANGKRMLKNTSCQSLTYGIYHPADIMAKDIQIKSTGCSFTLWTKSHQARLNLKITGLFNIYNVLAAVGALLAEGIDIEIIKRGIEEFTGVPGRFELIKTGKPFNIIVDFAHTPDALEKVLSTVQQFTTGRIITVFGCGGEFDPSKRPIMGKVVVKYADLALVTSDNPRSEDPKTILNEIETGIKEGLKETGIDHHYEMILDRRKAIAKAIEIAKEGDTVIIAGKGAENYQKFKDHTINFNDKEVVLEIINSIQLCNN